MHKGFCYSIFRNFSRLCYGSPRAENCRNHINWQVLHVGKDRAQIFAIGAENCNCSIIVCLCPCSICWPIKMLKFMPNSSGFRLLSSAGAYTRQIQSKSAAFSGKLKKKFYKEMHKGFCYSIFRNFSRLCYGSPRAENCRNHINWQVLHVGKDRAQIFAIGAENCIIVPS